MPEVNIEFPDVFILCGGKGTRFRAVREDIPKALAPINGVPFLDLLLNNLVGQGCQRIILGTGYLSEQIESHIQHRFDAEYLVVLQPTSPLRKIKTVINFVNHCVKNRYTNCLSVTLNQ